jgi:hypothetical protein
VVQTFVPDGARSRVAPSDASRAAFASGERFGGVQSITSRYDAAM